MESKIKMGVQRELVCGRFCVRSNTKMVVLEGDGKTLIRFYSLGGFDAFVEFLIQARKQIRKDVKEAGE